MEWNIRKVSLFAPSLSQLCLHGEFTDIPLFFGHRLCTFIVDEPEDSLYNNQYGMELIIGCHPKLNTRDPQRCRVYVNRWPWKCNDSQPSI